MANEMIYDIKIYTSDDLLNTVRPRRINENGYHIEWHHEGILFVQCPNGKVQSVNGKIGDIDVESDMLVPWRNMMRDEDDNELFNFRQTDGTILYSIRVILRDADAWLELCTTIPNNINAEVMRQMAQILEWKCTLQLPTIEINDICEKLQKYLPAGFDDMFRDTFLDTWMQRLEERLAQDMLSKNGDKVSVAVESFKYLVLHKK